MFVQLNICLSSVDHGNSPHDSTPSLIIRYMNNEHFALSIINCRIACIFSLLVKTVMSCHMDFVLLGRSCREYEGGVPQPLAGRWMIGITRSIQVSISQ